MRPNLTNWVVGGSSVDNSGSVIGGATPTGPSTWFMGPGFNLAAASPQSWQAVTIPTAVNTSTPSIGRVKVDAIKGQIYVTPSAAVTAGRLTVAVAIYVSEFNSFSSKWDVRDPIVSADATRDDYYYLEFRELLTSTIGGSSAPMPVVFDLHIANPFTIGTGQAVHVTISQLNTSGQVVVVAGGFRTRIGPIA
jgi:hypothetical protein